MPRGVEWWANPLVGVASGLVAGITGVAAVPFLPYMQSLEMDRHELVQALGIMFLFIIGMLAVVLAWQGAYHLANLAGSVAAIAPTMAGRLARPARPPPALARDVPQGLHLRHVRRRPAHGERVAVERRMPLPDHKLIICGIPELPQHSLLGVSHVLSIIDTHEPRPPALDDYPDIDHELIRFDDVVAEYPGFEACTPQHIERLLDFGERAHAKAAAIC